MRERKGVQRTTAKTGGARRFPASIGPGRVAGQPRKARLHPCPIAGDTPLDTPLHTQLDGARRRQFRPMAAIRYRSTLMLMTTSACTAHTSAIHSGVTNRSCTMLSAPPVLMPNTPVSMCTSIP
jgi:hypothetical protein